MKLRLLVASLAAFAMAEVSPVAAADLKMPVKAPPIVAPPPVTWNGCYLGGNIGGGGGNEDHQDPLAVPPDPFFLGGHSVSSFIGGGQIGCDWQFAQRWVIGAQGMIDGASFTGTHLDPAIDFLSTRIPWFATASARLGFLPLPNLLLYVKGGGAWKRQNETIIDGVTLIPEAIGGANRSGYLIAGGVEWMFADRWSLFGEGGYMGFGRRTVNFTNLEIPPVPPVFPLNIRENLWYGIIGVNFHFWTGL